MLRKKVHFSQNFWPKNLQIQKKQYICNINNKERQLKEVAQAVFTQGTANEKENPARFSNEA